MFEFTFCVIGIYVCFITWGILQERVSTTPYNVFSPATSKFRYFLVLNLTQSISAALIGTIYLYVRRLLSSSSKPKPLLGPTAPALLKSYLLVAIFNSLASPFGYASLNHIDYPTMILGKSCKLLPVMFMSILIHKRRFPWYQYLSVALITIGVSGFMLTHEQEVTGKKKEARNNSWYGLFLLSVNLTIDGMTNSTQDSIFRKYKISGQQMMVMMNLFASAIMFLYLLLPFTNELSSGLSFLQTYPAVIYDIFLFSLAGALGQVFIFHTLSTFGSLSLVSVTVTRKMFSIIISVVWFGHSVGFLQWIFVLVVFLGIGVESFMKLRPKKSAVENPLSKEEGVELRNQGSMNSNGLLIGENGYSSSIHKKNQGKTVDQLNEIQRRRSHRKEL